MLREWVLTGENANACESALVLHRRNLQRVDGNEECLTIQQMFERKIPIEKIRAVVARGGGIPDKDAPGVAKLTSYWVETSRTRLNRDEQGQTSEIRVRGTAGGALDAMGLPLTPSTAAAANPANLEALVTEAQSAADAEPGPGVVSRFFVYSTSNTHTHINMRTKNISKKYHILAVGMHGIIFAFFNQMVFPPYRSCSKSKSEGESQG